MGKANRATTVLLGIIATILVGWVLHTGAEILKPLAIAFLLASMLQPIVIGLARRGIPPALTVVLMVWLLFLGLVQVGLLFQANLEVFLDGDGNVSQVEPASPDGQDPVTPLEGGDLEPGDSEPDATDTAPDAEDDKPERGPSYDPFAERQEELSKTAGGWTGILDGIRARLEASELPKGLVEYADKALRNIDLAGIVGDLAIGGLGFITTLLLVMIYMVFIFAEQAVFRRKILAIAGDRQDSAAEVLDTIGRGIQRYLGVKTVVSFLTGALCYLALVWMDIPYALLFGFLTFLLNYIPTFGSIIAGIFPFITALAFEASWVKAVIVVLVYLSVNLSLGSFIEPRILGRELNLSPLVVVVSVVVWAGLWGVVGGFLAVPLTAALQICLASSDTTRPVAIMLGSGPPREKRRKRRRGGGEGGPEENPSEAA
jgi:predicted PurR-regulated permease PerM